MRRRRVILVVSACMVAGVLAAFGETFGPEPEYGGKTLSQWLVAYGGLDSKRQSDLQYHTSPTVDPDVKDMAARAVRHIGTNALPFLREWRQGDRPAWTKGMKLWGSAWMEGYAILGPAASSAIPELAELTKANPDTNYAGWNAILALRFLGEGALPPLLAVLTNRTLVDGRRGNGAISIGTMRSLGSDVNRAVPILVRCLQDNEVAEDAALALGDLALSPELCVPALVKALARTDERVRWSAADALGRFGSAAKSAVPRLNRALSDRQELVRRCAREALKRIEMDVVYAKRAHGGTGK